jgi:hypothetical protein
VQREALLEKGDIGFTTSSQPRDQLDPLCLKQETKYLSAWHYQAQPLQRIMGRTLAGSIHKTWLALSQFDDQNVFLA